MKNLKLSSEISVQIKLLSEKEFLLFSAIDIERNRLFFASSANVIYTAPCPSPQNAKARSGVVLPAEVQPLDLETGDYITSFDYLMEKESLIIGTSNGLLLLHMVDRNATEMVGRVEGGVKCLTPSPDGDLLAVTTGLGQLLVMTHDWDLLNETEFEDCPEDVGVSETKALHPYSCTSPISWRGDGKYFATLSKVDSGSLYQIKVWERDSGLLYSASEPKTLDPAAFDWMPSGAKIATVCDRRADNKCALVAFFERNGLKRSSFSINEPVDACVQNLKWNCSSELLASVVRCEKYYCLKIWLFSNNHWYLKQEIRYLKQDGLRFMWDPTKPLQLICWTLNGQISLYCFNWVSAVTDTSIALVIDESKILVTALSLSFIPPPMYAFSLKFPSAVREMTLYSNDMKNLLAVFLSDGCLCVVELPALNFWEELEGKEFSVEASVSEIVVGSLLHLEWLDSHVLLGASSNGSCHKRNLSESKGQKLGYHLVEIDVICSEDRIVGAVTSSGWHTNVTNEILVEGLVVSIASDPSIRYSAFVQLNDGNIFKYVSEVGIPRSICARYLEKYDFSFSSPCPWMGVALATVNRQLNTLLFGLDELCRLHFNRNILSNNCTSFSFYSSSSDQVITHLILATKQDLLYIVDIADIVNGDAVMKYDNFLDVPSKRKEEGSSKFIKMWERGAKVIGVIHGDEAAVILQTIRGNLECVYPRKLVLTSIINALEQGHFKNALLMVRRHRIDFNIIVDYCSWPAFLEVAPNFVTQVKDLNFITEFVCAIKNENATETLYKNYILLPPSKEVNAEHGVYPANKITSVLSAIRKALEEYIPATPARELCILTTLARSDPPALEEALERIKITREMELAGSNDPRRLCYPSAEEALKHLLWLSDPDAVFEAALGLYDLNLAAIVALNAQRDPKEFLPVLQELESMPVLLMQYNIDLRLRRYEKALEHIVSAGDMYHAQCLALLKDHPQLFPIGIHMFSDPEKRMQIYEAWGDHLMDERLFEDAATTFLCCSNLEKTLKAYRAFGHWHGALTVAGLLNLGTEEVLRLAQELCEELRALGKPGEAARIAWEYCGDIHAAIGLLIDAREWEEALRIAFIRKKDKYIAEVKISSLECARTMFNEFEEGLEKIGKYLARYLAVRQRRLLLASKLQAEDRGLNDMDDDTRSEASSNVSGMSAYTTGTRTGSTASVTSSTASKARGKQRLRSRGKIRAGSPGEEMALVDHLRSMSLNSGTKTELKTLLNCLLMLGMEECAKKLQNIGVNFQLSQSAAVKLAEDAMSTDVINEQTFSLERYVLKVKNETSNSEAFAWRSEILSSP